MRHVSLLAMHWPVEIVIIFHVYWQPSNSYNGMDSPFTYLNHRWVPFDWFYQTSLVFVRFELTERRVSLFWSDQGQRLEVISICSDAYKRLWPRIYLIRLFSALTALSTLTMAEISSVLQILKVTHTVPKSVCEVCEWHMDCLLISTQKHT